MRRRTRGSLRGVVVAALCAVLVLDGCAVVHTDVPWRLAVGETPAGRVEQDVVAIAWPQVDGQPATLQAVRQEGQGVRYLEVHGTMTERKGLAGQVAHTGTIVFLAFASAGPQAVGSGGGGGGDGAAVAFFLILCLPALIGLVAALPAWTYALVSLPFYEVWAGDRWYDFEGAPVSLEELRDEAVRRGGVRYAPVATPTLRIELPPTADGVADDQADLEAEAWIDDDGA